MRFGNALRDMAESIVARATTRRLRFVEIVTQNDQWTPPAAKTAQLLALYNTNPWVRSIVGKIAQTAAAKKWYFEDAAGKRIDKHPALDFLNSGTKRLPARVARKITFVHMDLAGEAFWAFGLDGAGRAAQFAPIPPHWVTNVPADDDPKAVYEVQPKTGILYRIPASQIIHFRDPDPLDPYSRGSSHVRAASVELDTDAEAAKFLNSHFKNRARPDVIISGSKEAPLLDRDRARMEEVWHNKFHGSTKAGREFFSAGPLTVTPVTPTLREQELAKVKPFLAATVAEFYGVPPEILGRLENSNRATIDAADHLFGKFVIEPRLALMLDVLAPTLTELYGLEGLTLCHETAVQEDRAFTLSVMTSRAGAFTDNEFRTLAGRRPLEGKEYDEPRPDPAENDNGDGPDGSGDKPKGGKRAKKGADDTGKPVVSADDYRPTEKNTVSVSDIVRVASAHMDPQVSAEATRLMDELFLKLLETYGEELLGILEAENRFQVAGAVAEWLLERGSSLISGVDGTTRDALRASLVEGAAANEQVSKLAQRVEQIFDDAADARALAIGTTEATALTGFGSREAGIQAGFQRKKWLSSGDHVVRSSHRSMHGQIRPIRDNFQAPSGAQAQHPGAFGIAREDINCRCAIRPILDGEDTTRAVELTDAAYEAAWDGMHARAAKAIEAKMRDIFAAQKAVALEMLNRIGGPNVAIE